MDKPHKKLDIWKLAMELAMLIYQITEKFPSEEKFGLIAQLRRAAISIATNIAEGGARQGKAEFRNFLSMAQGSLSELDTQLGLAVRLGYFDGAKYDEVSSILVRVDKMLTALIRSLSKTKPGN